VYPNCFFRFPRCVGLYGDMASSERELLKYVELNNGLTDVYVCLYDVSYTIDKVFFDIDSHSLDRSFDAVKKLARRLEEYSLPYIPVFSGRKGFHVYIPVKAWTPPNIETAKAVLRDIQKSLAGDIKEADRHVFGDVKRKVRFPNTLNNGCYATPLPLDFTRWTLSDIVGFAKEPHDIEYDVKPTDLLALTEMEILYRDYAEDDVTASYDSMPRFRLVSKLLRPCLAKYLAVEKDPPHMVRLNLVAELRYLGFTEDQVVELIGELGWRDFDERVTRYHVHHIYERKYKPLTCRRLRDFVPCWNCGWFYWWGVYRKPW